MNDTFDLQRFVDAQAPVIHQVVGELTRGRKQTHWMWFVFPQLSGLGVSVMSQRYAISGRAEADAYLIHPVLGARLRACVEAILGVDGRTAVEIFGPVDAAKLRSCLTLFDAVAPDALFARALERFFDGVRDPETLSRL